MPESVSTSRACRSHRYYADTAAPSNPLTHYVIVRADLPRGLREAQIVHAAGESSPGNLPAGTYAIVLAVPDKHALAAEAYRLTKAGIPFTPIYEPDAPYCGELMALGLKPQRKEALKRHLSSLPLLK